jgi:hypothetical protein
VKPPPRDAPAHPGRGPRAPSVRSPAKQASVRRCRQMHPEHADGPAAGMPVPANRPPSTLASRATAPSHVPSACICAICLHLRRNLLASPRSAPGRQGFRPSSRKPEPHAPERPAQAPAPATHRHDVGRAAKTPCTNSVVSPCATSSPATRNETFARRAAPPRPDDPDRRVDRAGHPSRAGAAARPHAPEPPDRAHHRPSQPHSKTPCTNSVCSLWAAPSRVLRNETFARRDNRMPAGPSRAGCHSLAGPAAKPHAPEPPLMNDTTSPATRNETLLRRRNATGRVGRPDLPPRPCRPHCSTPCTSTQSHPALLRLA